MDRERCNFVYNGRVKSFILTFRYSIENNTQTLSMQEHKPPINQWAMDDRPREKLLRKKPNSLSDSELVAILIRIGSRQTNAVELARKVLELGKNNLNELAKLTLDELMQVKGIGQAKASAIAAALELGRRRQTALAGSGQEKPSGQEQPGGGGVSASAAPRFSP